MDAQLKQKAGNLIHVTTQILVYVFGCLLFRWLFSTSISYADNLPIKKGTLIVANHQSRFDPFLILFCLPPHKLLGVLPVRFPTNHDIYHDQRLNPWFFPVLTMLGCFSIGQNQQQKMQTLFYLREIIQQKTTVMLFPEGKTNREINVADFKQGINFFKDSAHSMIFVRLQGMHKEKLADKQATVTFSKVFNPPPAMNGIELAKYLDELRS